MKKPFLILIFLGACFGIISGCMKKQSFPETPAISYLGMELTYDQSNVLRQGILDISYQDGDGNIGLNDNDTFPPFQKNGPYYYNYVIKCFEKRNGVYEPLNDSIPFSARIPVLSPDDPNKAISGFIMDTITFYPPIFYDTIKFEAFIYDRSLNKSNVITTPEILRRRK